jgi:formyl-CoA transferase
VRSSKPCDGRGWQHQEQIIVEVDHPTRGKYLSVGNPIKLSDSPADVTCSPLLGEHTDEILRQVLGFSDHQVADIHDSGALDPPRKEAAE